MINLDSLSYGGGHIILASHMGECYGVPKVTKPHNYGYP